MRLQRLGRPCEEIGEVGVALVEYDQRGFAIAPSQVAEQLIDAPCQFNRPAPKLAFGNKGSATIGLDADVGLATAAEGLAGRVTLVMAVEMREQNVAEPLLAEVGVGGRRGLKCPPFVADDIENVLIVFAGDTGLWGARLRAPRARPNKLSLDRNTIEVRCPFTSPERDVERPHDCIVLTEPRPTRVDRRAGRSLEAIVGIDKLFCLIREVNPDTVEVVI